MNKFPQTTKYLRILTWIIFWIIVILVAVEFLISNGWPWRFSSIEPYLLRKNNDDWTHNAFEIQRIKSHYRDEDMDTFIIFTGGSSSLEAIYKDTILSKKISELSGQKIQFISLCASYQTFSDTAKIISELGSFGGTLLIGIEPLSFKATNNSQLIEKLTSGHTHLKYYYLTTPYNIKRILIKNGIKVGLFHRFNLFRTSMVLGEILKKKIIHFIELGGRFEYIVHDRHAVGDKTPVNEKDRRSQINWLKKLLKKYREFYQMNMDLLREVINIAQSNGNHIILVDLPNNPIYKSQISKFNPHYDNMIRNLVEKKGIGYIDLRNVVEWTPEDFRDVHHIRSPGQKKLTEALALKLVEYH